MREIISGKQFKRTTLLFVVVSLTTYSYSTQAGPPSPPVLFVSTERTMVYLSWNAVTDATGYTLLYAPYPSGSPISSIDLGGSTFISGELPIGSAFYVALQSYNEEGTEGNSNIESFTITNDVSVGPKISYSFGDDVDLEDKLEIQSSVIRAEGFFDSHNLPQYSSNTLVLAFADYNALLAAYSLNFGSDLSTADQVWQSSIAVAGPGKLIINANNSWWTATSEGLRAKVIAHELFHVLQYQLTGDVPLGEGPTWLLEGSAELLGHMAADWSGLLSIQSELQYHIGGANSVDFELEDMESASGFFAVPSAYSIAFLAAELLSNNPSTFVAFYSALSEGVGWREAFSQIFGISIDAFYEDFKEYKDGGY